MSKHSGLKRDLHQEITDKIISVLERGAKPWVRPWNATRDVNLYMPYNPFTGSNYHGINTLLLWATGLQYDNNAWATYKQVKDAGGQVRRGEHGHTVVFYKSLTITEKDDTGSDAESLIARTIDGYDGVEPSGNSSAALAFLRLHAYGVREGFDADALRIFSGFKQHLQQSGTGFPAMLAALDFHLAPPLEIAIVGDRSHPTTQAMLEVVHRRYLPAAVVAFATPEEVASLGGAIPLLQEREAIGGKPTAYICHDMTCQLPVHTPDDLIGQISQLQTSQL